MNSFDISSDVILSALEPIRVENLISIKVTQFAVDSRDINGDNGFFAAIKLTSDQVDQRKWYRVYHQTKTHYFDHHEYINDAIQRGARVIVCESIPTQTFSNVMYIQVSNVIDSLGKLAKFIIEKNKIPIVAVTGSSGKTTTCHAISEVLNQSVNTQQIYTYRPTPISLPLSILNSLVSSKSNIGSFVVEMPTDHIGCITKLSTISKPDFSILLNVKDAHLNVFGSLEETARAKSEILSALKDGGIAIINGDDPYIRAIRTTLGNKKTIVFGCNGDSDVLGRVVELNETSSRYAISYRGEEVLVDFPLIGKSAIYILLAAASTCIGFGMNLDAIANGLKLFTPMVGRMNWLYCDHGRVKIFDNSAKCNTTNLRDMLISIEDSNWTGLKILILSDFFFHEHPYPEKNIWMLISQLFDYVVLYQKEAHGYADLISSASEKSVESQIIKTSTDTETFQTVAELCNNSNPCYIVITGHEFTHLESVVNKIKQYYDENSK